MRGKMKRRGNVAPWFYIKKTHSKEWSEPVVNCVWVRCKINCYPKGVVYFEIVYVNPSSQYVCKGLSASGWSSKASIAIISGSAPLAAIKVL